MRVLMLSPHSWAGGAERACREQAEDLRALGHEVTHAVAMPRATEPDTVLPLGHRNDRFLFPLDAFPWTRDRWRRGMDRAVRALDPARFDVLHLHNLHGRWMSPRSVLRLARALPTVWTLHDEWAPNRGVVYDLRRATGHTRAHAAARAAGPRLPLGPVSKKKHTERWIAELAPHIDAVVSPSAWLADWAAVSGVFGSRDSGSVAGDIPIRTIRNGVRMASLEEATIDRAQARAALGIDPDAPTLMLIAGSLDHPHKGIALAADAIRMLPNARELTVLLVGKGFDAIPLPVSRVVGDEIHDDRALALRYRAADATVLPSMLDNAPYTALESFACGTPIVGFDNDGIRELSGGGARGWLAVPGEHRALSAAIRSALSDRAHTQRLGAAAREWVVRSCDPTACARSLADLYSEILVRPRA